MRDQYGRELRDLRISLTDRCNLRCVYCMPAEGIVFRPPEDLLQDDELLLLVRIAAELGVRKVRLTGGEPTVRPGIVDLVREIASEHGLEAVVDVEGTVFEHVSQVRETDMRFLERRALLRGYEVFVTGRQLVVRRRERRIPRHVLEYRGSRHNLAEFRPRWRTLTAKRESLVLSWDPKTKTPVIGQARELEQAGGREVTVEEQPASRLDAVRMAMAAREEAEIRALEADAVPEPPLQDLALGDVVEVLGVGRRFSGGYFVARIQDTWDGSGLSQELGLQQALELEEREAAALGLASPEG